MPKASSAAGFGEICPQSVSGTSDRYGVVHTARMAEQGSGTPGDQGSPTPVDNGGTAAVPGRIVGALVVAIVSFPFAVWWLSGHVSRGVSLADDPDYFLRPPHIDPALARTVGIASISLCAIGLAIALRASWTRLLRGRWWAVIGPLLLAGAVLGIGERVMTAPVIGANIGAGFVLVAGVPFVLASVAWAVSWGMYLRRHPSPGVTPGGDSGPRSTLGGRPTRG
jgi:hypothetical protein